MGSQFTRKYTFMQLRSILAEATQSSCLTRPGRPNCAVDIINSADGGAQRVRGGVLLQSLLQEVQSDGVSAGQTPQGVDPHTEPSWWRRTGEGQEVPVRGLGVR